MGAISFRQPFYDCNRDTALGFGQDLLQLHGYLLPTLTPSEKSEIYELLTRIMYEGPKLYPALADYIRSKAVSF